MGYGLSRGVPHGTMCSQRNILSWSMLLSVSQINYMHNSDIRKRSQNILVKAVWSESKTYRPRWTAEIKCELSGFPDIRETSDHL